MRTAQFAVLLVAFMSIPLPGPVPAASGARLADNLAPFLADSAPEISVVIRFVSEPTADDATLLARLGFVGPFVRFHVVPAVAAVGSASAVRALLDEPRVAFVEHDAVLPYTLDRATTVGRAKPVWNATYNLSGATHTGGFTGRGVGVAVVDSGVDATHPDLLWKPVADAAGLQATTVANYKMVGRDSAALSGNVPLVDGFLEANGLAVDMANTDVTGGHGTHVAGIVGGNGAASGGRFRGAAPEVDLIGFGAGETLLVTEGLAAFDWIHLHHAEHNIRVVTNSWGGAGDWDPELAITIAARELVNDDGLLVVFAAGNDGGDGSTIETSVWANIPEVMSVANYYDRAGWVDDSSSRGRKTLERTWPDLAAPGTQIISTAYLAGPATAICTGQDALINVLLGFGEPNVVPVPAPFPIETSVAGEDVLLGWYASCTGTSMATPFVSGVAALLFEANPALTPFQVRDILTATADMPEGRTYEDDGFAIGHGVIDAVQAVAVALRMRDGASLVEALSTGYADLSTSPALLNFESPTHLAIDTPTAGSGVTGAVLVEGRLVPGVVADGTVPLQPAPVEGTGIVVATNLIFHGGLFAIVANAFAPGEPVSIESRDLHSEDAGVTLTAGGFTVAEVVRDVDGAEVARFAATVTGTGPFAASADWTIPTDAAGKYTLTSEVTVGSETYLADILPFTVASVEPPPILGSSTTFSTGFENGVDGWTVQTDGSPTTEWSLQGGSPVGLTAFGTHSGDGMWWAGDLAQGALGTTFTYGPFADTSLISPPINLASAGTATLSYWRAGGSEADFDILRVYAAVDGSSTWTQVDSVSGDALLSLFAVGGRNWEESTADLTSFVGSTIRLRFTFTSDEITLGPEATGWYIDDVTVTAGAGGGGTVVVPSFSSNATFGVDGLLANFTFSGVSNAAITGYSLDFGDGSPIYTTSTAGTVEHVYAVGQPLATLTVSAGATSASTTLAIDVAPSGMIQVRIAGGEWVDAGAADGTTESSFSATLDLAGIPPGPALIEARWFGAAGRALADAVSVVVS